MSIDKSDWKTFLQLSNNLVIRDVEGGGETVVSGIEHGEWVAFAVYDDDRVDLLNGVMLAKPQVAEFLSRKEGKRLKRSMEELEIEVKNGLLALFDSRMDGRWPVGFELDERLRNNDLDREWGRPEDKDGEKAFYELAHHLAIDGNCNMMRVESGGFGVFAGMLAAKRAKCAVLRNPETMKVDALEVKVVR